MQLCACWSVCACIRCVRPHCMCAQVVMRPACWRASQARAQPMWVCVPCGWSTACVECRGEMWVMCQRRHIWHTHPGVANVTLNTPHSVISAGEVPHSHHSVSGAVGAISGGSRTPPRSTAGAPHRFAPFDGCGAARSGFPQRREGVEGTSVTLGVQTQVVSQTDCQGYPGMVRRPLTQHKNGRDENFYSMSYRTDIQNLAARNDRLASWLQFLASRS